MWACVCVYLHVVVFEVLHGAAGQAEPHADGLGHRLVHLHTQHTEKAVTRIRYSFAVEGPRRT